MEPVKQIDYSGGAKAFNIKISNLTSEPAKDMTEMIFSGEMSIQKASNFFKTSIIKAADRGADSELIDAYASMAAFTSIGAETEKMLPKDKKVAFVRNYMAPIRRGGDESWLDTDGNGLTDYNEMSEYLNNTLLELNTNVVGKNSISLNTLNKANEAILDNACFNEDGSVKLKNQELQTNPFAPAEADTSKTH